MTRDEAYDLIDYRLRAMNDDEAYTELSAALDLCFIDEELRQKLTNSQQALRNVYEVWAGSEGIQMPMNAGEYYLLDMIARMRDAAKDGMK